MTTWTKNTGLMILIFWIIVPTLDNYSDILMVTLLFNGPQPDLEVYGGIYLYKTLEEPLYLF